ncbi:MAG TPA: hypothetical protein VJK48_04330 [Chlamydiales bacterium]|nr:hypothetical protein [Chlamydiales bacterium]
MDKEKLLQKVAKLESINDQLTAELDYLDQLVRELGFAEGIKTLKSAALELLEEQKKKKEEPGKS